MKRWILAALSLSLILCGCASSSYKRSTERGEIYKISLAAMLDKVQRKDTFAVMLTQTYCGYCQDFEEMLTAYLKDRSYIFFYVMSVLFLMYLLYSAITTYFTLQTYCKTYSTTMLKEWTYCLQVGLAAVVPCLAYACTMYGIALLMKSGNTKNLKQSSNEQTTTVEELGSLHDIKEMVKKELQKP